MLNLVGTPGPVGTDRRASNNNMGLIKAGG